MGRLNRNMSIEEFDNNYFYAIELKEFAKSLGINVGCLRKNELEEHIKAHLSGKINPLLPKNVSNRKTSGSRDKLATDSLIVNYVSDKITKSFLKKEIQKIDPNIKDKSGQWYWLNDWRKEQVRKNKKVTYLDLINQLYKLMSTKERLPRIPSTRYNNFITDFLADSDYKDITRQEAIAHWEKLKELPIPKNYLEYKNFLMKK